MKNHMEKLTLLLSVIALISFASSNSMGEAASHQVGETLYKKHCVACHPDADKLRSAKDIVRIMRRQMASMPEFGEDKISNDDAKKIEAYIHQDVKQAADQSGNNM